MFPFLKIPILIFSLALLVASLFGIKECHKNQKIKKEIIKNNLKRDEALKEESQKVEKQIQKEKRTFEKQKEKANKTYEQKKDKEKPKALEITPEELQKKRKEFFDKFQGVT